jgi:hypothetical protein
MPKPGAGMPLELLPILKGVPSTDQILAEVVESAGLARLDRETISTTFDTILQLMMDEGKRILQSHQRAVTRRLIQFYLSTDTTNPELAAAILEKGFTSLGNQRKKRAGVHMEKCVKYLLTRCDIPSEEAPAVSGQSDLVVPNAQVLRDRPERAVVLEFKRTIRERWKEVRDEIARTGYRVWLLTLDDYLSNDVVTLMASSKITLYVPSPVFSALATNTGHLRSLRTLVTDLDEFVRRQPADKASGR